MSLGTYLFGATLAVVLVSMCYGGICDAGPPGEFCFQDLTGYDDCHVDRKTGKMVDDKHTCPRGTRCTCMGIACPAGNPCGRYRLPPVWPEDYHIDFNVIDKICSPAGCHTTYSRFAMWRDTRNKKYRLDRTISTSPVYDYFIVLPTNSTYEVYHIIPASTSCTKGTTKYFPAKISDIPRKFKFNGYEVITGINTTRWLWLEGGRNSGQQIISQIWNSYQNNKPLEYRFHDPGNEMTKTDRNIQAYIGLFVPGTPNPDAFDLPSYCHRERESYPLSNMDHDTSFEDLKLPL